MKLTILRAVVRFFAFAASLLPCFAYSALHDRGNGLIFDSATNLTWISSATLAAGSPFDDGAVSSDGKLTFESASAWVDQLSIAHPSSGTVIADWRLPRVPDAAATCGSSLESAGQCGYVGASDGASELARLVHGSLGNAPRFVAANSGPFGQIPIGFAWLAQRYPSPDYLPNVSSFLTVEGWLVRDPSHDWPPSLAWALGLGGAQGPATVLLSVTTPAGVYQSEGYAWAVRDGDVIPIPEPSALSLLAAGVALLGARFAPRFGTIARKHSSAATGSCTATSSASGISSGAS